MLRALRSRNYRLYFSGQMVSLIGSFMTQTAMSWLVYRLAREGAGGVQRAPFLLGLVLFAGQIPLFFLTPFAGVWVDRLNRRKLLIVTQALAMVQSLSLATLAFTHITINEVLGLALFQGLINAFDMPGRQAFVVDLVEAREDLPNAIALNSSMLQGARLIGPAIAGFLVAARGEGICFLIDGVSYIAVIGSLIAMTVVASGRGRVRDTAFNEFNDGLRYVWGFVPIRALLCLTALLCLMGMPALQVMIPVYAGQVLSEGTHGAQTLGFLTAALGAGAAVGGLRLAARKTVVGLGRIIWIAAGVFGAAEIAFAWSEHIWLSMMIAAVAGCAMISAFASVSTILQTLAEDEKRGRVMSFYTMAFGMMPFGALLAGWAAQHAGTGVDGPRRVMMGSGILSLLIAGGFRLTLPALRKLIRPVYVQKGILPVMAEGLREAAEAGRGG
jgi:MFS family permease